MEGNLHSQVNVMSRGCGQEAGPTRLEQLHANGRRAISARDVFSESASNLPAFHSKVLDFVYSGNADLVRGYLAWADFTYNFII